MIEESDILKMHISRLHKIKFEINKSFSGGIGMTVTEELGFVDAIIKLELSQKLSLCISLLDQIAKRL